MSSLAKFAALGLNHLRNSLAETVYVQTGLDFTRPVTVYGLVNERCNLKCGSCHYWRMDHYTDEMSIEEWKAALTSLKDLMGRVQINFSGGEPFIKKGFIDLLSWCRDAAIDAGVTTNGLALTNTVIDRLVAARPFNVNISVDAPHAALHDRLRGYQGLFDRVEQAIERIRLEKNAQNLHFPLIIKTVISRENVTLLPDIVRWAEDRGASAVHFQPIGKWTEEAATDLWIDAQHLPQLQRTVEKLLEMKRDGAGIMNSRESLAAIPAHFRGETAPREALPCRIGMQALFIYHDGSVGTCNEFARIGSVKEQSARAIWYGPQARAVRRQTIDCTKLCLNTCKSNKSTAEKIRMSLLMLRTAAA